MAEQGWLSWVPGFGESEKVTQAKKQYKERLEYMKGLIEDELKALEAGDYKKRSDDDPFPPGEIIKTSAMLIADMNYLHGLIEDK